MKRLFGFVASFIFLSAGHAAIIGKDDRKDIIDTPKLSELARSTAVQIPKLNILNQANGLFSFDFQSLENSWGVCSDEKFSQQPVSPIACTGFLVGPDLLMTAGHCLVNWTKVVNEVTPHCEAFSWAFDHVLDRNGNVQITDVPADRIYSCKRVIYANFDVQFNQATKQNSFGEDVALIQLDRPVTGRKILKISESAAVNGMTIRSIGYPSGLPAKSVLDAFIFTAKDANFVETNLDAIGGSSGSPVFNSKDEVIGVVVRAFPSDDYFSDKRGCNRVNRCTADRKTCSLLDDTGRVHSTEIQRASAILPYLREN